MTVCTQSDRISIELLANLRRILADRLFTLRKKRGWRQPDLAAACGLSSATIAQYEQQKRCPQPEDLNAIARALGVDPLALFLEEPERRNPTPEEALDVLRDYVALTRSQK